jgi:hypothetical protein
MENLAPMDHLGRNQQPFSVGNVLGRSFSIWFKNLVPFSILSLLVHAPIVLYTILTMQGELTIKKITTWGLVVTPGTIVLSLVATGAMTYGVFQDLRGARVGLGECISVGLKRLLPVLGVGLVTGLAVMGGIIALIIPGIIIICMLWVAVPVSVVENAGVGAALSHSRELTAGYRWHIFGILFILGLFNKAVTKVLEIVMLGSGTSFDTIRTFLLLAVIVGALIGTLSAVANAVAYHDLRVAKEGVSADDLAKVFD